MSAMSDIDATRRLALEAYAQRFPTARTARLLANDVAIVHAAADGDYTFNIVRDALHDAACDIRDNDPTYVSCACFRCDGYALTSCLNNYDAVTT